MVQLEESLSPIPVTSLPWRDRQHGRSSLSPFLPNNVLEIISYHPPLSQTRSQDSVMDNPEFPPAVTPIPFRFGDSKTAAGCPRHKNLIVTQELRPEETAFLISYLQRRSFLSASAHVQNMTPLKTSYPYHLLSSIFLGHPPVLLHYHLFGSGRLNWERTLLRDWQRSFPHRWPALLRRKN